MAKPADFKPVKDRKICRTFTIKSNQDKALETLSGLWDMSESEVVRNLLDLALDPVCKANGIKL